MASFGREIHGEHTRWLDNAKIRLGWGKVGNQNISSNAYLTTMDSGIRYVLGTDPTMYPATIVGTTGNPNLRWETVEDIDFGIDLSLFNSRLNVTLISSRRLHMICYMASRVCCFSVCRNGWVP